MKFCRKCGKDKDFSAFSKDRSRKDGHSPACKDCVREYQSQPHVQEIKRKAQAKYSKTENGRNAERRHSPKRRERIRALGRNKVYYLVRRNLAKSPCEVCGDTSAQAHHEDYARPLDVRWLCPYHHAREHKGHANA